MKQKKLKMKYIIVLLLCIACIIGCKGAGAGTETPGADADSSTETGSVTESAADSSTLTAVITLTDNTVMIGESFTLSGENSSDTEGDITSYFWIFDDGNFEQGDTVTHFYSLSGTYDVELIIHNERGDTSTVKETITVVDNQKPSAVFTVSALSVMTGTQIDFNASAANDPDGSITSLIWNFGDGSYAIGENVSHIYQAVGQFYAELTAFDNWGESGTEGQLITVNSAVNNAPEANAGDDQVIDVNESGSIVNLDGSQSLDSDGSIVSYQWTFEEMPYQSSMHNSFISNADSAAASFDFANEASALPDEDGKFIYKLKLKIVDDEGGVSVDFVTVTITCRGTIDVIIH